MATRSKFGFNLELSRINRDNLPAGVYDGCCFFAQQLSGLCLANLNRIATSREIPGLDRFQTYFVVEIALRIHELDLLWQLFSSIPYARKIS